MPKTYEPLATARRLAKVYGYKLDSPVVYTQGAALSGRLRLLEIEGTFDTQNASSEGTEREIKKIIAPRLDEGMAMFGTGGGTANYAGICWADELYRATGNQQYLDLLTEVANLYEIPNKEKPIAPPLDADIRVEDFFFAATILGRAFEQTGNKRYLDVLVSFLLAADTQQDNGLWWHCRSSPYYWGRGNAFAAMGFSETLTYLPADHPYRGDLISKHIRHLEALRSIQDKSGMWRQVLDIGDSYLEHSATTMIGYALARGIRLGWLEAEWQEVADKAWEGAASRINLKCELEHVCVGTGPQPDLTSYVERPYVDGLDDRGGSMSLWFAVEMARHQMGIQNSTDSMP